MSQGKTKYKLDEVFNEAHLPEVTFVAPAQFKDIVAAVKTKGKHLTVAGPSGCGKTTLVRMALAEAGLNESHSSWISGRDFSAMTSWQEVLAAAFGCEANEETIKQWLSAAGIFVIDDFHHLSRKVRDEIAYLMKRWHELGIRIIAIGIAASSMQLLAIDEELSIRNEPFDINTQSPDFIREVVRKGEAALNLKFGNAVREDYIKAAQGIPSAIHVICRVACVRSDVFVTGDNPKEIALTLPEIRDAIIRTYRARYHNRLVGLIKGKAQARSVHNTYFDIVKNICLLDKTEISTGELRDRIVAIVSDSTERGKKNTSFHNCLNNLEYVIAERKLEDAIYYDRVGSVISIEDPAFRFYLNFVDIDEIAKAVNVRKSAYPWDVAVSFAGEHRDKVEEFRHIINSAGYTVFYDFDQKHMLWGQNLRQKLRDTYSNEAEFMVVFLSKEYPEKDWTSFEFDVGKEARHKRTKEYLLPVIIDDVTVVGLSSDYGYVDARTTSIQEIANLLIKKLEHS